MQSNRGHHGPSACRRARPAGPRPQPARAARLHQGRGARVAFFDKAPEPGQGRARGLAESGSPASWWEAGNGVDIPALQRALARAAQALGEHRVRIHIVSPGRVMTERQRRRHLDERRERALREAQCLPDLLQPEDVARRVLFLASDDAARCTAREFKVDAGWM